MPKKTNTPQITTPAPRSLKQAWDKECNRLKWAVEGVDFPGDLQKGLIALFLREPESKRDEIAPRATSVYREDWTDSDGAPVALQSKGPLGPGSDNLDGKGDNRIASNLRLPRGKK